MGRVIRNEANAPMPVKVGNETKRARMCGLSSNQPLGDGSHKKTADKEAGKIYIYHQAVTKSEAKHSYKSSCSAYRSNILGRYDALNGQLCIQEDVLPQYR